MKSIVLHESPSHQWIVYGRDEGKPEKLLDTNQYMIRTHDQAMLLDPGGIELFAPMLAAVLRDVPLAQITHLFASHQDPDVISSLGLWDEVLPQATLHAPWLWEGFIRHFGMNNISFDPIEDRGGRLQLGPVELEFIPAHYLHSSGNIHVFDASTGILFSGDIGAALESVDVPLFVEDFDEHISKMRFFHQRWMPSNEAKNQWIRRVRKLKITMICPQHGRIFRGNHINQFLDWLESLEEGMAHG